MAYFDGQPAIVYRSGGQISAYYGGIGPDMVMSEPQVDPWARIPSIRSCLRARVVRLS